MASALEIVSFIGSNLVFIVVGIYLSKLDGWYETRKRGDLRGRWLSVSHGGDHKCVQDEVTISHRRGKLHLRNKGNESGYVYEAFCSVRTDTTLVGTWRSLRKGANIRGDVLLVIDPQGTSIAGVYTGKDIEGRNRILPWILARDAGALEEALKRANSIIEKLETRELRRILTSSEHQRKK